MALWEFNIDLGNHQWHQRMNIIVSSYFNGHPRTALQIAERRLTLPVSSIYASPKNRLHLFLNKLLIVQEFEKRNCEAHTEFATGCLQKRLIGFIHSQLYSFPTNVSFPRMNKLANKTQGLGGLKKLSIREVFRHSAKVTNGVMCTVNEPSDWAILHR